MAAVALLAENTSDCPLQMGLLVIKFVEGTGFKIIEAVAEELQLKAEPITVYCALLTGESVKLLPAADCGLPGIQV